MVKGSGEAVPALILRHLKAPWFPNVLFLVGLVRRFLMMPLLPKEAERVGVAR